MRISRRRLGPAEIDYELLWLAVSLGGLACAALWLGAGLPWPRCVFHDLTGHPCLTCGGTRSGIAFFHGDLGAALRFNPLVFAALCAIAFFDLYAFAVLLTRAPRLRIAEMSRVERGLARGLVIVLLAGNWIYLLQQ